MDIISRIIKPRTLFTAGFFGATIYLLINGQEVPGILKTIDFSLLGFYFGEKASKKLK